MPEITINYRRISNEIPPRCRKPRYVSYEESVAVGLREFDREDARLAFTVKHGSYSLTPLIEIYTIEGLLYTPVSNPDTGKRVRFDDEEFSKSRDYGTRTIESSDAEDAEETVRGSIAGKFILVDGEVFTVCSEPHWRVSTPMVGDPLLMAEVPQRIRSSRGAETTFRADERDEAIAYAQSLVRGPGIVSFGEDDIIIHDPESVRLVTVIPETQAIADLRIDYSMACSSLMKARTNEEESAAFENVAALRGKLLDSGAMPKETTMSPYEDRPDVREKMGL